MSFLAESATYTSGIYQIELADVVQGGVDGLSNTQAQQLANRTAWLYQQVQQINSLLAGGSLFTNLSGGTINNTVIGNTSPSTAAFTTLHVLGTSALDGAVTLGATLSVAGAATFAAITASSVTTASAHVTGGAIDGTPIGGTTPAAGSFTAVSASSVAATGNITAGGNATIAGTVTAGHVATADARVTGGAVDGTPVGGTTPAAGAFTTVAAASANVTGAVAAGSVSTASATITGGSVNGTPVGGTTPAAGAFTTLVAQSASVSGTVTVAGVLTAGGVTTAAASITGGTINGTSVGSVNPAAGAFTTLQSASLNTGSVTATGNGSFAGNVTITGTISSGNATVGTLTANGAVSLTAGGTSTTPPVGDSTTKIATTAFVQAAAAGSIPPGTTAHFAGTAAPAGWLVRDGSSVSRTAYAALFAAIGTTWGAGDGTTTFNLPNAQRRVDVGSGGTSSATLGNTVGSTGGEEAHTLTQAELPNVSLGNGVVDDTGVCFNYGKITTDIPGLASQTMSADTGGQPLTYQGLTEPLGSGAPHNTMQPSGVYLPIIKY